MSFLPYISAGQVRDASPTFLHEGLKKCPMWASPKASHIFEPLQKRTSELKIKRQRKHAFEF